MKRIILFLILCGWCAGATRYVSTTGTNSGDALTEGTAWLTIRYAMENADSGDTIKVSPGTYAETQGNILVMGSSTDGKDLTVERNGDSGQVAIQTSLGSLTALAGHASGDVTFKYIDFIAGAGAGYVMSIASGGDIEFENCIIDGRAATNLTGGILQEVGLAAETTRDIVFSECTVYVHATDTTGTAFYRPSGSNTYRGGIQLADCNFYNCISGILPLIALTWTDIEIKDCTFIGGPVATDNLILSDGNADTFDFETINIENNTFVDFAGGIFIKYGTGSSLNISNNRFSFTQNLGTMGIGVGLDSGAKTNPIADRITVTANRVVASGDAEGDFHSMLIGVNADEAYVANNHFEGGNAQIVVKGDRCTVSSNFCKGERGLTIRQGMDNVIKNCVFHITDASYGYAIDDNSQATYDPDRNWIINCIFNLEAGGYIYDDLEENDSYDIYVNNCLYDLGSGKMASINDTDYDTLAALKTKWLTYSAYAKNDSNSGTDAVSVSAKSDSVSLDSYGTKEWVGIPQSETSRGLFSGGLFSN